MTRTEWGYTIVASLKDSYPIIIFLIGVYLYAWTFAFFACGAWIFWILLKAVEEAYREELVTKPKSKSKAYGV